MFYDNGKVEGKERSDGILKRQVLGLSRLECLCQEDQNISTEQVGVFAEVLPLLCSLCVEPNAGDS